MAGIADLRSSQATVARPLVTPEERQRTCAAEVLGTGGVRWLGDPVANTRELVALSERHGDDSPAVRQHVAAMRAKATRD